jgi:hypothetical protein
MIIGWTFFQLAGAPGARAQRPFTVSRWWNIVIAFFFNISSASTPVDAAGAGGFPGVGLLSGRTRQQAASKIDCIRRVLVIAWAALHYLYRTGRWDFVGAHPIFSRVLPARTFTHTRTENNKRGWNGKTRPVSRATIVLLAISATFAFRKLSHFAPKNNSPVAIEVDMWKVLLILIGIWFHRRTRTQINIQQA